MVACLLASSLVLAFSDGADLDLGIVARTPLLEGDEALAGSGGENSLDVGLDVGQVRLVGEVQVLSDLTIGSHKEENLLLDVDAGQFGLIDDGSGDHITSTEGLFVLFVCEDVLGGDHSLGGSVLSGLSSGEGGNLAGESLFHDEEGAGLHAASFSELGVQSTRVTWGHHRTRPASGGSEA